MSKKESLMKEDSGEVYFITTDKYFFPVRLRKAEERPKSEQLKEEEYFREHGLVPLPFEVSGLLLLQDNCTYFDSCVKQIAKDVVGQGYKVIPTEEGKEDKDEEKRVKNFLMDPNPEEETISEITEKAIIDWGVIGWLSIELQRGKDDIAIGLWHVPAHTIKVHESMTKFCQTRNQKRVWFKRFSSPEDISSKTGEPIKGPKNVAHELIYYRNYYEQSDYYGAPNILPAVGSVRGLIGVRDYNLAFFENYGIPAALVTLKGKWREGSTKQLSDFIDVEIKGSESSHKTAVLRCPVDGEVKVDKLGVDVKEGSFKLYQKSLRDEVLSAYKMPPYRIGIAEVGALGGTTAIEASKIYISSVVNPLKRATADIITKMIIRGALNSELYAFEWNPLEIRDLSAEVKVDQMLFGMGALTPNYLIKKYKTGETYAEGDQHFVSAGYAPLEGGSIEKQRQVVLTGIEDVKQMIEEAIEEAKVRLLPLGVDEEGAHG